MKKYKLTGCARFFIALIIIGVIAFFAARFLADGDGVSKIQDWLGELNSEAKVEKVERSGSSNVDNLTKKISSLEEEIERLKRENKWLKQQNEELKKTSPQKVIK
jgi:predicted RNase H-like nuclease (RuvC/YqgF family)